MPQVCALGARGTLEVLLLDKEIGLECPLVSCGSGKQHVYHELVVSDSVRSSWSCPVLVDYHINTVSFFPSVQFMERMVSTEE